MTLDVISQTLREVSLILESREDILIALMDIHDLFNANMEYSTAKKTLWYACFIADASTGASSLVIDVLLPELCLECGWDQKISKPADFCAKADDHGKELIEIHKI